jgi:DNA-directed RNA polymerase specialized sigma24 family protein
MRAPRQAISKNQTVPPRQAAEGVGVAYAGTVEQCYATRYHFAFGLTGGESDAADLTQETDQVLLTKDETILDARKMKSSWFTTLYQQYLERRRWRAPATNLSRLGIIRPPDTPPLREHDHTNY